MNEITNNSSKCSMALMALHNVLDPEIGLNVVDLGLIYEINFDDVNSKINVAMSLTSQFCPMGESIIAAVKRVLETTFSGMDIQLDLIFNPPWNPEMISDKGKEFLFL
jgi:metal-sulfur cluster biosynthetic enzyme